MMKKIILFSPNGYIGGFIKEKIMAEDNIRLYEITRGSDLEQYKESYDVLIYSASATHGTAEKYIQDNVVTAVSIVNFCKLHSIGRIIYLSSDSIYGEINTKIVAEKAVMVNPDMYGLSKYLAEKIIAESGIPYFILRLPGVVGRTWRKNFICSLIDRIKNNENIEVYNLDRDFNNILDIDDLTKFIILLCDHESKDKSEIFLLGNTEKIKLKQVVAYINEIYCSASQISSSDTDAERYFTLDVTKAVEYGYSSKKIKTIIEELCKIQEEEQT